MSEFDGEPVPPDLPDPATFTVRELCANHHACECNAKKLKAAEESFRDQVAAIRRNQELYEKAASDLIALYRSFDKSLRHALKAKLKEAYESLKDLGVGVGVSRSSMPGIAEG